MSTDADGKVASLLCWTPGFRTRAARDGNRPRTGQNLRNPLANHACANSGSRQQAPIPIRQRPATSPVAAQLHRRWTIPAQLSLRSRPQATPRLRPSFCRPPSCLRDNRPLHHSRFHRNPKHDRPIRQVRSSLRLRCQHSLSTIAPQNSRCVDFQIRPYQSVASRCRHRIGPRS